MIIMLFILCCINACIISIVIIADHKYFYARANVFLMKLEG